MGTLDQSPTGSLMSPRSRLALVFLLRSWWERLREQALVRTED